jgi:beta-glucosidase
MLSRLLYLFFFASTAYSAVPEGSGIGAWSSAYSKAEDAVGQLSLTDKVNIVTGVGWSNGPCVGNTKSVSSIGYPELCLQDSPLGIRYVKQTTAWPAGIQAGATWDRSLMYARGHGLGQEAKGVGVHVQLGPVAGVFTFQQCLLK